MSSGWKDHSQEGETFTLKHLDPFSFAVDVAATEKHQARHCRVVVSFRCHVFTTKTEPSDRPEWRYLHTTETRTFSPERYRLSHQLPEILKRLSTLRVQYAEDQNGFIHYVTVELTDGEKYAAFFDLRRFRDRGRIVKNALHLDCKSAFPVRNDPGKGKISFPAMIGRALNGDPIRMPAEFRKP